MSKPQFSIIVPVYNVEKYVGQCLRTLVDTERDDYEIIVIDDGSLDASFSICKEFENRNERIRIVKKENEGLSAARNDGLKLATGDYIVFVDSDDWVDKGYLETIAEAVDESLNSEIIVFGYEKINEKTGVKEGVFLKSNIYTKKEIGDAVAYLDKNGIALNLAWNKVYKKNLFSKYIFDSTIKYIEDIKLNSMLFGEIESLYICNRHYYKYRITDYSLSNNHFYSDYHILREEAVSLRNALYEKLGIINKYSDILMSKEADYLLGEVSNMYRIGSTFKKNYRIGVLRNVQARLWEMRISKSFFNRMQRLQLFIITSFSPILVDTFFKALFYIKNNNYKIYGELKRMGNL